MNEEKEKVWPDYSGLADLEASFGGKKILVERVERLSQDQTISGLIALGTLAVAGVTVWQMEGVVACVTTACILTFGVFSMVFCERQYGCKEEEIETRHCPDESGDATPGPS